MSKQRIPESSLERRKFQSARQEATVMLLKTADVLRRRLDALFEPYGLTGQQYNVLRILRGAAPGRLPTMDIADRMIEQAPGITRLLDRLHEKGLIERERCAEDRRRVLCSATREALELLAALDAPVDVADEMGFAELDDAEVAAFLDMLARIRAALA